MAELRQLTHDPRPELPAWRAPQHYEALRTAEFAQGDARDLLRKIWRRKGLVLGVLGGFVIAGLAINGLLPERYTGEVRILVGIQEPRVANFESVLKGVAANTETVQSEAYVIASNEVARKVGYRLALDKSPEFNPSLKPKTEWQLFADWFRDIGRSVGDWFRSDSGSEPSEDAASTEETVGKEERFWQRIDARLLNRIEVLPLNRSHVLSVTTESEDPVLAARLANTLGEVYVEQQLTRKRRATDKANDWLQKRIDELRVNVEKSARAVEEYRRQNGLYETKTDTVIAQQLGALNRDLIAAENQKAEAEVRVAQTAAQAANPGRVESLPAVLQSPAILALRGRQVELERQAAELSAAYTNKHPKMRDVRAQMADINAKIKQEIQRVLSGLRHEARMAQERYDRIAARMDELKGQMGQSNEQSVKLRELEREAQANRTLLESLLQRSKETVDQQEIMNSDTEIISRANVPLRPSFPPTNVILVLSVLGGLGCGVLLALVLESFDQTFRTGEEVEEYTGLPTLALLPIMKERRRAPDHIVRQPHSNFTGSLRMLSARLSLGSGGMPNLMMFTSALPGEGKSRLSSSFAQLLALDGRRVIVLDLDWRQPTLHRVFGQRRGVGVADLLNGDIGPEQAVYRDRHSGAHVMFAGNVNRIRANAGWLERMRMLLYTLSRHYDVVILDTSPVLVAPEVLHLARLVEKTILVVKWASTPRSAVAGEIKNLLSVGADVPGIVLSQVDPRRYNKYGYEDAAYLRHSYWAHNAA